MLLNPPQAPLSRNNLEQHLQRQLDHVWTSISDASAQQGVKHYLKFAERCDWTQQRILPDWDTMTNNVMLWMLDAVQTYSYRTEHGLQHKQAISATSLSTYMSHVNAWYAEATNQPRGVTTQPKPRKLLAELTRALPRSNCQKRGLTANDMRAILHAIDCEAGHHRLMWRAIFQLAWFGVLRPGECVPQAAQAFDASKHPTKASVRFFMQNTQICPRTQAHLTPTHMELIVKYSKTD